MSNILTSRLRTLFAAQGLLSAKEAAAFLAVSQPTISRTLAALGDEVIQIGSARSRKYALRKKLDSLPRSFVPVLQIDSKGNAIHVADLHPIVPKSFYVESHSKVIRSQYYPDLPYWLDDLRPSGFLGRLIPKHYPELNFPADIALWDAYDCLRYWVAMGVDLVGDLVIGEQAYSRLQSSALVPAVELKKRATEYDELADDVLMHGAAGSSAAGEQPKFIASVGTEKIKVLVKFSPEGNDPIARRRKDLLHCEHICLSTLRQFGFEAATSEIVVSKRRVFLEVKRFDRIAEKGRRGILSLHALDAEFTGRAGSWREIARALLEGRKISRAVFDEILRRYYFGICVGNTDMHAGNLSFYANGEEIKSLAPTYDMLPMLFAPIHESVRVPSYAPPALLPNDKEFWEPMLKPAISFWKHVEKESAISRDVRQAAKAWASELDALV